MTSKTDNRQRALAHELLGIQRRIGDDLSKMEDIKRELREIATDRGENFKEEFAGEGVVKVAGKKDGKFKGVMPALIAEKFLALSEARRKTLEKAGLVVMESQYASPFYGSVTIDVF
jgi:hypothetical protein